MPVMAAVAVEHTVDAGYKLGSLS